MRDDCFTTPEITFSAGAGEFVGTLETEATLEVCVTVSPDLSGVDVPIPTVPHPTEDGLLPVEIGNCPRIVIFIVAAAPAVAILEDFATSAGFREQHLSDDLSRHFGGVLSRRSSESTAGNRGMSALLIPFRDRER